MKWKANAQLVPIPSHSINVGWDGTFYNILKNDVAPFGDISAVEPRSAPKDNGARNGILL